VREKAQEKVFSDLGRVQHLKKKGVLIGVGGCVASQEGAEIIKRAPYVDVVFGPQTLHRLPELLDRAPAQAASAGGHQLPRDREVRPPAARAGGGARRLREHHGRLQQVLQLLRGALHARRGSQRPFDDVLVEIAGLADQGVREVTLLGQNVNAYRGPWAAPARSPTSRC
jgi:tRNA-2-methylthio-N6-dimethylallyladenosine synthase